MREAGAAPDFVARHHVQGQRLVHHGLFGQNEAADRGREDRFDNRREERNDQYPNEPCCSGPCRCFYSRTGKHAVQHLGIVAEFFLDNVFLRKVKTRLLLYRTTTDLDVVFFLTGAF